MARHLSRYLWTAMKDGSRKPAEATRWMKAWGSAAGWPLAWSTDDWRQNSSDNRRSRTTASSLARIRCRARTRAWRARIRQSPLYLLGCRNFQFASHFRTFPDILPPVLVLILVRFRCRTRGSRAGVMVGNGFPGWEQASVSRAGQSHYKLRLVCPKCTPSRGQEKLGWEHNPNPVFLAAAGIQSPLSQLTWSGYPGRLASQPRRPVRCGSLLGCSTYFDVGKGSGFPLRRE